MTEDEMVGWHHRLNGHGFEPTPGDGEGQGGLACCSPWGRKESDTTERRNNHKVRQAFTNVDRQGDKASPFPVSFPPSVEKRAQFRARTPGRL